LQQLLITLLTAAYVDEHYEGTHICVSITTMLMPTQHSITLCIHCLSFFIIRHIRISSATVC